MGLVNFTAPMERDVRGINLQTGRGLIIAAGQTEEIEPGTWEFSVLERGSTIGKRVLDVASPISMSLPSALEDPVRGSIVHALKYNDPGSSVVDFSESLGETANRDLGLWLTVMAAAHIIGPGNFEKLGDLSLAGFDDIGPNMTGLYVIAGLEHYGGVNVHTGGDWTKLAPVPALFKISHAKLEAAPGQVLFSVELEGHEVRTFPTWMLPNRVTLIVLSEDERQRLVVSQFMIPVLRLLDQLPRQVRDYLSKQSPLQMVRTMYTFQNLFSRGRILAPPDPRERMQWDDLLNAKWLDPITSLIVCYDVIRRGRRVVEGDHPRSRPSEPPNPLSRSSGHRSHFGAA